MKITPAIKTEIKKNLSVGIPLTTAQLIYSLTGFIGVVMVAKLGTDALAASVLVWTLWMCISVFFFGMFNSISVLVSQQNGAQNYHHISIIMAQAYRLGCIICIPTMIILWFSPYLLSYSHQNPQVILLAKHYLHTLLFSLPGTILLITLEQFLAGISKTKISLFISFIEVPLEIGLIYILVFGKLGLPKMGIAGVGLGFAISYTITGLGLALYLAYSSQFKIYGLYKSIRIFNYSYLKEMIRVGWPIGMMALIEVGALSVMTFIMARFDSTTLAAHQIAFQYLGFFITIAFNMAQATTIRVGHSIGEQNLLAVKQSALIGMILTVSTMSIASLFCLLFPHLLIRIDLPNSHDLTLLSLAQLLLAIVAIFQFIDSIRIAGVGALRGIKDTRIPMWISGLSFWVVGISSAYFFGFRHHLAGPGVWWGFTFGISIGMVIISLRTYILFKKLDLTTLQNILNRNQLQNK